MLKKTYYEIHSERREELGKKLTPILNGWLEKNADKSVDILQLVDYLTLSARLDNDMHHGSEALAWAIDKVMYDLIDTSLTVDENASHPIQVSIARQMETLGMNLGRSKSEARGETVVMFHKLWQQKMHEAHGKRVYTLSAGLMDRLLWTEVRGIKTSQVELPFKSIYVQVPKGLYIPNSQSGMHMVTGVFISQAQVFAHEENEGLLVLFVGESKNEDNPGDDALFSYAVPRKDEPVSETLKQLVDKWTHSEQCLSAEESEAMEQTFRFLINVILYASSSDVRSQVKEVNPARNALIKKIEKADPKDKTRKAKLKAALAEEPSYKRIYLGGGLKKLAEEAQSQGIPLMKRVLVAGHWRNQPCGPRNMERKLIFIQPHWRGPDYASVDEKPERRVLG